MLNIFMVAPELVVSDLISTFTTELHGDEDWIVGYKGKLEVWVGVFVVTRCVFFVTLVPEALATTGVSFPAPYRL